MVTACRQLLALLVLLVNNDAKVSAKASAVVGTVSTFSPANGRGHTRLVLLALLLLLARLLATAILAQPSQ